VAAVLVGLLVGFLLWGSQSRRLAAELDTTRAGLAAAEQAAVQQGALAARLEAAETQLKQATARLASERELRERLEKLVRRPPR
jgi:hypothetical protein